MNRTVLAAAVYLVFSTAHANTPDAQQDAHKAAPAESHADDHGGAPKDDPFKLILVDCSAFVKHTDGWTVVKPTSVYAKSPTATLDRVGLAPGFPVDTVTTNSIPLPAVLAKRCGS